VLDRICQVALTMQINARKRQFLTLKINATIDVFGNPPCRRGGEGSVVGSQILDGLAAPRSILV
jgi:hypothetical protein